MILSHQHRLIFIKTRKTAGTSIELALSEICGPDDVITPVSAPDERKRKGRRPQNFRWPGEETLFSRAKALFRAKPETGEDRGRFWQHMNAVQIRMAAGAEVFDGYLKVSVERNPWDREVSSYHWTYRSAKEKPAFRDFVLDDRLRRPFHNWDKYTIDGRIVADMVMRHDRLAADFAALMTRLGVESPPSMPDAKATFRPDATRDYRQLFDEAMREKIARLYAREIEAFDFVF